MNEFTRCKAASCSARSRQAACLSGAAKIRCYPEEPFAPCTLAPDCSAAGLRMLMATGKRPRCCSSLRWVEVRTATPPVGGCRFWRRSPANPHLPRLRRRLGASAATTAHRGSCPARPVALPHRLAFCRSSAAPGPLFYGRRPLEAPATRNPKGSPPPSTTPAAGDLAGGRSPHLPPPADLPHLPPLTGVLVSVRKINSGGASSPSSSFCDGIARTRARDE